MAENDEIVYADEEEDNNGIFRWLQIGVVLFAVTGFFGLAWYAYNSNDTVDEKNIEIVKADKTPVKEAPANPGGMNIPNQDKTVYGLVNGNKEKQVVERVLPATEEPVIRDNTPKDTNAPHESESETWVNNKINPAATPQPQPAPQAPQLATPPVAVEAPKNQPVTEPKKAEPFIPQKVNNEVRDIAQNDAPPAATPAPAKAPEQEVQAPKKAPPIVKTVAAKPASGKLPLIRIQLGAFKSEADANKEWKKASSKFASSLKSKTKYIVKVNIPDKGTFYRLQAGAFDSKLHAEHFCKTLNQAGQACLLAKK